MARIKCLMFVRKESKEQIKDKTRTNKEKMAEGKERNRIKGMKETKKEREKCFLISSVFLYDGIFK
jgi:hypothetical protein